MSNIDNLDSKTDAGLDELFAVEVTGARRTPPFCTDPAAVLPWLEKCAHGWDCSFQVGQCLSGNYRVRFDGHCGVSNSFARSAVLALLRSKRSRP